MLKNTGLKIKLSLETEHEKSLRIFYDIVK